MTFEEIKKEVETSADYSFLKTDSHLGDKIILLGLGGSYAYGTNTENSDIDVRGITANDKNDILHAGIEKYSFEQFDDDDTDTVIYSFNKMIRLLSECNPNTIEILGSPRDEYLVITDVGKELLDMAPCFLSKRCEKTFTGYANQQLYRLKQKSLCAMTPEEYNEHIVKVLKTMTERFEKQGLESDALIPIIIGGDIHVLVKNGIDIPAEKLKIYLNELNTTINDYTKISKRNKKAAEHGKINKHAMHLLRLYMMGVDIAKNKEIVTKRVNEHDLLMDIRNGKFSDANGTPNKDFFDMVEEYERKFEEALKNTTLPDEPDYEKIYKFVDKVNRKLIEE